MKMTDAELQQARETETVISNAIMLAAEEQDPLVGLVDIQHTCGGRRLPVWVGDVGISFAWDSCNPRGFSIGHGELTKTLDWWAKYVSRLCQGAVIDILNGRYESKRTFVDVESTGMTPRRETLSQKDVVNSKCDVIMCRPKPSRVMSVFVGRYSDGRYSASDVLPENVLIGVKRHALRLYTMSHSLVMVNETATRISKVSTLEFYGKCVCVDPSKITIWESKETKT